MENKALFKATISPFSNSILIANSMKSKPFKRGYKSPKMPKYIEAKIGDEYSWNEKGYLVDKFNKVVPSNASKAGKPRIWICNTQDLYNGKINEHARNVYIQKLEDYIRPYIEETDFIEETNLGVSLHFYLIDKTKNTTTDNKMVDEDNLTYIWHKSIRDLLKGLIIPDDSQKYIRASYNEIDYVLTEEETRLEITIWKR